jgi:hypothetical protein
VSANPEEEFTYLVDHYRTWILTVAHEARQYHALGFRVYNSTDMIEVTQWVNPTTAPDTTDAFRSQNEETDRVLEALEDEADAGRYREDKGKLHGVLSHRSYHTLTFQRPPFQPRYTDKE